LTLKPAKPSARVAGARRPPSHPHSEGPRSEHPLAGVFHLAGRRSPRESRRVKAMEIEGPFLKRFQICAFGLDNECLKTLEEADTLDTFIDVVASGASDVGASL
jgi:hypothetical protein